VFIDVHGHIGAYKEISVPGKWGEVTPERLLEYMDFTTIDRAVVMPVESRDLASKGKYFMPTKHVLEVCNKFPDRLIPFCNVDPRDEDLAEKIRRFIDLGCKGFGEHKVELRVDHPRSQEIYRVCGKLEIPLLIHIDNVCNPDVVAYDEMVKKFSSTVFIAHGIGWWKEISGKVDPKVNYPSGKVEPGGRVDRILQNYPNAYGDLSAGSGYNALNRDLQFAKDFVKRNYKKLLYGTDLVNFFDKPYDLGKLLDSLRLSSPVYRAVAYKNAETLLKLG